jgi:flagellar export protein FliJ
MKTASLKRVELLLRLRRQEEQQVRSVFVSARAKVQQCIDLRDRLQDSFTQQNRYVRSAIQGGRPASVAGAALGRYRQAIGQLRSALAQAQQSLEQAWDEMEGCRQELLSAIKQRKAMELLGSRLGRGVNLLDDRRAEKELDEQYAPASAMKDGR